MRLFFLKSADPRRLRTHRKLLRWSKQARQWDLALSNLFGIEAYYAALSLGRV